MNATQDQVQFIIEMDQKNKSDLGIGLVRNEEYIGLYFNLTAWQIYKPKNVIQLTLRKGSWMIRVYMISLWYHLNDQAMLK